MNELLVYVIINRYCAQARETSGNGIVLILSTKILAINKCYDLNKLRR